MTIDDVVIEAGHIYADQQPQEEHFKGAQVARAIQHQLNTADVKNWLFVDDYNPDTSRLDIATYQDQLASHGFPIDRTVKESTVATWAEDIVEYLLWHGHAVQDGNGGAELQNGTGLYKGGDYQCSLLDATLYLEKLGVADHAVTVLPATYREQQQKTADVLNALHVDQSQITRVYFDNGNVYVPEDTGLVIPSVGETV